MRILLTILSLLAAAAAGATAAKRLGEGEILAQLETSGQLTPDETLALLKQLGPTYQENELDVGELLEQVDSVSELACKHAKQRLTERNTKLTMFKLEAGQYEAVVELLEEAYRRQLEACLHEAGSKLDRLLAGKLRASKRANLELFHATVQEYATAGRMPGSELDDVLAVAARKYAQLKARAQRSGLSLGRVAHKVTSKRKLRKRALESLRETCGVIRVELESLGELVNLAEAQRLGAQQMTPEMVKWSEVLKYCARLGAAGNSGPSAKLNTALQEFIAEGEEDADVEFPYAPDDDEEDDN